MTKRITIFVNENIDKIREVIAEQTGVKMTYVQAFDHLIDFYIKHASEPRSRWLPLFKFDKKIRGGTEG